MTKDIQKNIILRVAQEYNLTEKVVDALFTLVDENKHWRTKSDNALRLAFKKLVTYTEDEQLEFIEKAIIGQYRGVVWKCKDKAQENKDISKLQMAYNLFK